MSLGSASESAGRCKDTLNRGSFGPLANAGFPLEESRSSGAASYWEGYLADVPVLGLPTDRPRPAKLLPAMSVEPRRLPEKLSDGIRRLQQETGLEDAIFALSAFAVLLYRYTAQEKFVVGADRGDGQFLPIVADFSDQPSFSQLKLRLEAAIRNGWKAGALPADLSERLGIDPDPSRHAIFQAAFSRHSDEVTATPPSSPLRMPATGVDLHLELCGSSVLTLRLHYSQELFDLGTAARILVHIEQLLAGAIEDPDRACAKLPMLTESELREQLVERNDTTRNFPPGCLHELVEAMAEKAPHEVAVVHAQEQLSYGELNARANQLAHYLRKRGIGRNGRVGICLKRSLEFAIALVGVLKSGGGCVPLDPAYPDERLELMLSDVAAPVVLTEPGVLQASVPEGTEVLFLSEQREMLAREPRSNPQPGSIPSDIAYIIYTSGSTGRPRGVLLAHSGLVNYTRGAAEMFALRPGERVLQFCSISFDAAVEEIFSTWAAGATLVFRTEDLSLEPSEFLQWVGEQHIAVLDLPTAYWHEWVYALPGLSQKVPPGVRLVIVGGEKSSPEAYSTWHKFVGNRVRWINTYGPAEASVVATAYEPRLQPGDEPPAVLPIGRPVANARVYLLDPHLNPVPTGVPGELYIGGVGVAQGYLHLPRLTKERFIPDIFSDVPSARLYKTGDLARRLPSGDIEFLGRRDEQVKIRGFRVEPGEIESILRKHAQVREAAVVLREDQPGNKRLVAYVVSSQQGNAAERELRRHVQKRLPEYMVPAEFVFLESMPLSPNGKVNRRALPRPQLNSTAGAIHPTAPEDPLQAQLLRIWEELLGRKAIGIRENFFELGGHSLLAARMMHRVKQVLGKTIPLALLLQAPTVEQLAIALRDDLSQHWSSLVPIQPEGSKPPFFCVHGVGGNVVGFIELAKRMAPDYPFYGLQSQGLDGKCAPHSCIEEMAAHYLSEIRTVQAKGPYQLGGFSFGGLVAYEMACQLLAQGEEVSLLALFDTYASNPKPVKLSDILRHPSPGQLKRLPGALRKKVRRTLIAWRLPEVLKNVLRSNTRAAEQYRLRPYGGKATLLRADDTFRVADDPYARWGELVGTLETIKISGDHMEILREPQVGHLVECLKGCIDACSLGEPEVLVRNIC